MERRVAPLAALFVVLAVAGRAAARRTRPTANPLAAVTWPVSTPARVRGPDGWSVRVGRVRRDHERRSGRPSTLPALELVYVTSTGSTVTRKASWATTLLLGAGRHLLIANSAGIYAGLADATYSGGFAATGGAIVLRRDRRRADRRGRLGRRDQHLRRGIRRRRRPPPDRASSGSPAASAATRSTRTPTRPTGSPRPRRIPSRSPRHRFPRPGASPTPRRDGRTDAVAGRPARPIHRRRRPPRHPSQRPAADRQRHTDGRLRSAPATPTAAPTPSRRPAPRRRRRPRPRRRLANDGTTPTRRSPTPTPTPTAAPTPTPAPTATPLPRSSRSSQPARLAERHARARVTGVLTTHLGALESGRKAFIQDDTGGDRALPRRGRHRRAPRRTRWSRSSGTLDDRFAERTLRVNVADVVSLGGQQRPPPWQQPTGEIGEARRGHARIVQGVTVGSPTRPLRRPRPDGRRRHGRGPGDRRAGSARRRSRVPSGTLVVAVGPVGQRDSSGTGLAGYRVHATEPSDFGILVRRRRARRATPTPTATPAPSPPTDAPAPTRDAAPTVTPAPTPPDAAPTPSRRPRPPPPERDAERSTSPSPTPGPTAPPTITIVEARGAPVGTVVTVAGVVTAEAGRLGCRRVIAIARRHRRDRRSAAGAACRRPAAARPSRSRGRSPIRTGSSSSGPTVRLPGHRPRAACPSPVRLAAGDLGEATEGRLAELTGTVRPRPAEGHERRPDDRPVVDAAGTSFRVVADGSSGIHRDGPREGPLLPADGHRRPASIAQRRARWVPAAPARSRGHRARRRADPAAPVPARVPARAARPPAARPRRDADLDGARRSPRARSTIEATVTAGVSAARHERAADRRPGRLGRDRGAPARRQRRPAVGSSSASPARPASPGARRASGRPNVAVDRARAQA